MHEEDHAEVERHPGHVEEGERSLARQVLTDGGEIVQGLGTDTRSTFQGVGGHDVEGPSPKVLLNLAADADQQPRPEVFKKSIIGVDDQNDHDQRDKRRNAARCQDPVIDLQHEQRTGQHQDVDDAAEDGRGHEGPAAGLVDRLQFIWFGWGTLRHSVILTQRTDGSIHHNVSTISSTRPF
jgi:hypothetical protein